MDYILTLFSSLLIVGYIFSWITAIPNLSMVGYLMMSIIMLFLVIYFLTLQFQTHINMGNSLLSLNLVRENITKIIVSILSIVILSAITYISIQYKKVLKHKNELPQLNEFYITTNVLLLLFLITYISYSVHHLYKNHSMYQTTRLGNINHMIGSSNYTGLVLYGLLFLLGLFTYMIYSTLNYYPTTDIYETFQVSSSEEEA